MNFYAEQDNAKKKTKYLVLLYVLILLLLTLLSTLVLALFMPLFSGQSLSISGDILSLRFWQSLFSSQNLPLLLGVGSFVVGGALISSLVKARHLSKGGAVIAGALGGVKLLPNTRDINERKALNVVEEMAIASGMPVPEVFVLRNENAINAFAAGQTPQDAVIGLTQGCIDKLTRTQLQGVVGHEFSHILNGDMRLNLRIIMLLYGIEFIALLGRILSSSSRSRSRSRSKGKGNGAIILAGIALRIIGWFGILFGNMIQAAVSRQREFLADASSVQFTRDPDSIAGALKVIGFVTEGSRLKNTDVREVSHLFFGQAFYTRLAFLFATHPPIDQRIQRIQPNWDGAFLKPLPPPKKPPEAVSLDGSETSSNGVLLHPMLDNLPQPLAMLMAAGVMVEHLSETSQNTLLQLVEKSQDPMEAMALVLAILACEESDNQDNMPALDWHFLLKSDSVDGLEKLVQTQLALVLSVDLVNRLPLIELTIPTLKSLSDKQYIEFKALMQAVMDFDGQQSIFEQSLFRLVTRYLDVHFGLVKVNQVRYRKPKQVAMELQIVISALVHYGHNEASLNLNTLTMDLAFKKAVKHLGLDDLKRVEFDEEHQTLFERSVEKLLYCSEPIKQQIIEALALCIEHDGKIEPVEKELVLAIAATMNAPIPRLSF